MTAPPHLVLMLCVSIIACNRSTASPEAIVEAKMKKAEYCQDHICEGDVVPKRDPKTEVVLKLNNQFFIGPNEYFSRGANGAAFYWPSKKPAGRSHTKDDAPEFTPSGPRQLSNFSDVAIEIFFRSNNIPPDPRGYKLIELANKNGWILSSEETRPGLLKIQMKHVIGPRGYYIDHVTYYVATKLKGLDGLPPVSTCDHKQPDSSGGTGFMWQEGIWIGTRMNQKYCQDWPDIYQETMRVLSLLRKVRGQHLGDLQKKNNK